MGYLQLYHTQGAEAFGLLKIQHANDFFKYNLFPFIHYFRHIVVMTGSLSFSVQCRHSERGLQGAVHSLLKTLQQPAPVLLSRTFSPDAISGLALGQSYANIKMP